MGVIASIIVVSFSLWIGNVYGQFNSINGKLSDHSENIATLTECAKNTTEKLERIENKLDRILFNGQKIGMRQVANCA